MSKSYRTAGLDQLGPVQKIVPYEKLFNHNPHIWTLRQRAESSTRRRKVKVTLAKV